MSDTLSYFQICVVGSSVQAIFDPIKNVGRKKFQMIAKVISEKLEKYGNVSTQLYDLEVDSVVIKQVINPEYKHPSRFWPRPPSLPTEYSEMQLEFFDLQKEVECVLGLSQPRHSTIGIELFSASFSFLMLIVIPLLPDSHVSTLSFLILALIGGLPMVISIAAGQSEIRKIAALAREVKKLAPPLDEQLKEERKKRRQKCDEVEKLLKDCGEKKPDERTLKSASVLALHRARRPRSRYGRRYA